MASADSIAAYLACRLLWIEVSLVVQASISVFSEVDWVVAELIAAVIVPVVGSTAVVAVVFSDAAKELTAAWVPLGSAA